MKKLLSIFTAIIALLGLFAFFIQNAEARFSGGHSSSSHSSGSHSSGSSFSWSSHSSSYSDSNNSASAAKWDDIGLSVFIIFIIFVLLIIFIIYSSNSKTVISQSNINNFDESQLINFKQRDVNFSRIVFLDFVHLLYVKFYSYYGKKEFSYLKPYLDESIQNDKMLDLLISRQVIIINEIVINSARIYSINSTATDDSITVEIESNFTVCPVQQSGEQHSRYIRTERWFLQRNKGLLSPAPETMQALSCPACGAAANFTDAGECQSCRTVIIKGKQQWYVKDRFVLNQTLLNTGDLVAYSEEQGTDLRTQTSPTLLQEIANFEKQRAIIWSDYWINFKQQIVQNYFVELNTAWTNHDLTKVRHLVSDRLYEANSFWMALYKKQQWNNRLDDLKISDIQLVKIELDIYYETITVRVFASCFDYTQDKQNKIIGGSNKKRRDYSEYWTFARRAGVEQTEESPFNINSCPQCGAPADKMGQTAICEYCGSKISTGKFSWVLFLITQDEVYLG
jgi:hypothetical protein